MVNGKTYWKMEKAPSKNEGAFDFTL